jgi:hypothetical protein
VNLGQHRLERFLDGGEALGDDEHPQQRRPRIPVLSPGPGGASASSSGPAIRSAGRPASSIVIARATASGSLWAAGRREPRRASTGVTCCALRAS